MPTTSNANTDFDSETGIESLTKLHKSYTSTFETTLFADNTHLNFADNSLNNLQMKGGVEIGKVKKWFD